MLEYTVLGLFQPSGPVHFPTSGEGSLVSSRGKLVYERLLGIPRAEILVIDV